jgi:hypothetical protein
MQSPKALFKLENLVPELRAEFERQPPDPTVMIQVAMQAKDPATTGGAVVPAIADRRLISLTDGKLFWNWQVDSLHALFRGTNLPPVLGDYPEAYEEPFLILDYHALRLSDVVGDRRDTEMKEIYSTLRRRPDGKSRGMEHDYMWQAAALLLGMWPLSQAEFEAIVARLERSCRTFEDGPSSRNYVTSLRTLFERESE